MSCSDSSKNFEEIAKNSSLQHIAFIPDGNRRWAEKKGVASFSGHKFGMDKIKEICLLLIKYHIKYATFYCFSTENWKRSVDEVGYLMNLFLNIFDDSEKFLSENKIRIEVIGDISKLSKELREKISIVKNQTKNNDKITVVVAISYSGRDEIIRAMKKMYLDFSENKLDPGEINEEKFSKYLDTPNIPYPDVLVRTSEKRKGFMVV